MKTTKKDKDFDAVKMMRTIRDRISTDTQNMTYEEFKLYVEKRLKNSKLKLEL